MEGRSFWRQAGGRSVSRVKGQDSESSEGSKEVDGLSQSHHAASQLPGGLTLGFCFSMESTKFLMGVEYRVGTGGYLPVFDHV